MADTSGATRIWVLRTTPTMGAVTSGCHKAYPPAGHDEDYADREDGMGLLAICMSRLFRRENRRERQIDRREDPKTAPAARYLQRLASCLMRTMPSMAKSDGTM